MTLPEIYDRPLEGADYVLQIRVKNGPLLRALRTRCPNMTLVQVAEAAGVHYSALNTYLNLRRAPIGKRGWNTAALALAKYLHLPPDSLFPEQHLEQALAQHTGEIEVSREEVCLMLAPPEQQSADEAMQREQVAQRLYTSMQKLTPREERVVRLRFGFEGEPLTIDAIAASLGGISRARVQQIEWKALRKLRSFPNKQLLYRAGVESMGITSTAKTDRPRRAKEAARETRQRLENEKNRLRRQAEEDIARAERQQRARQRGTMSVDEYARILEGQDEAYLRLLTMNVPRRR